MPGGFFLGALNFARGGVCRQAEAVSAAFMPMALTKPGFCVAAQMATFCFTNIVVGSLPGLLARIHRTGGSAKTGPVGVNRLAALVALAAGKITAQDSAGCRHAMLSHRAPA